MIHFILQKPTRLDQALLHYFQSQSLHPISRKAIQQCIRLFLPQRSPSELLKPHLVTLELSKSLWNEALAQKMNPQAQVSPADFQIPILYEDDSLLVLNKPHQIPSLPLHPEETKTAVNFALRHCPQLALIQRKSKLKSLEPGLLHRLDTPTSGILVFAKTQLEFNRLYLLWSTQQIQKIYRARVSPQPHAVPLASLIQTHTGWMGHLRHSKKMIYGTSCHLKHIRGKPLPIQTTFLKFHRATPPYVDLDIQIHTGVLHQIRCHLSTLGWPILGDSLYQGIPAPRLGLHAWKLSLPSQNLSWLHLEAPLPEPWQEISRKSVVQN